MKKKFGSVILAGLMACSITAGVGATAGCKVAKITDFVLPKGGYDGSKVSITFANTMGQNLERILSDALADFKELYPNITVTVDNSQKNYDNLNERIGKQILGGKQPNIAYCYPDHVAQYNQSRAVLALDEFFLPGSGHESVKVTNAKGETESLGLTQEQVDDYVTEFFNEGRVFEDGHTYTLPFAKSTEVMYYNQTYFDAHPELTVPKTWKEMAATCAKIRELENNNSKMYPLGYDSDSNFFITLCEQYGEPYTSATGEHFLFDTEKNREFMEMLKDWYKDGYFTTEGVYGTFTSDLFTKQNCYMSIGSTGGSSYQDPGTSDNTANFTVGVTTIPQVDPDHPKSILQGPSVCIFKKSNPQEVIASWLLVKFLTTDVNFQGRFSETSGYMPVTKTAFNSDAYQDFLSEVDNTSGLTARAALACSELVKKDGFYTSPAFIGSSKAREQVGLILSGVLLGTYTDIDTAFKTAIRTCKEFVGDYN